MRIFRKVILPVVWVAIFSVIAVSLAMLAFGSDPKEPGSGVKPTGEIVVSNTGVTRGTIENSLQVRGTIVVDPPVSAKATHDGVVNYFFVPVGARVRVGDNLFQVRSEGEAAEGDDGDDEKKPAPRYHTVVATKSGKVAAFTKELGDTVTKGDVVTSIRQETFQASGSMSAVDQYRLLDPPRSAKVTIAGGPAPFACRDLTIGGATAPAAPEGEGDEPVEEIDPGAESSGGEGGGTTVTCRIPDGVKVFDGLDMTMTIKAGRAEDVLVVPVTAVRGLVGKGTVWVITDGQPVERKVRLGLSDGELVEVTKGLEEGEDVLEFVPGGSPVGDEDDVYIEEMG